ncbi:MAG: RraA family protein [Veillonella sp.]|nr:RraA family protein [Veillonella sp.]
MPLSVFPNVEVADESLLERLRHVSSCAVSDALRTLRVVEGGCLPASIQNIAYKQTMVGTATTVFAPDGTSLALHMSMLTHATNRVLVVATNGYHHIAYMGDIQALLAQRNGCLGIILDGFVRDKEGISQLDIPVFAKGSLPSHSVKEEKGSINAPIAIGNVIINPGDVIIGDNDGAVVIPRHALKRVVEHAEEKERVDAARQERVAQFDFQNVEDVTEYMNIVVQDVAHYIEEHQDRLEKIRKIVNKPE